MRACRYVSSVTSQIRLPRPQYTDGGGGAAANVEHLDENETINRLLPVKLLMKYLKSPQKLKMAGISLCRTAYTFTSLPFLRVNTATRNVTDCKSSLLRRKRWLWRRLCFHLFSAFHFIFFLFRQFIYGWLESINTCLSRKVKESITRKITCAPLNWYWIIQPTRARMAMSWIMVAFKRHKSSC